MRKLLAILTALIFITSCSPDTGRRLDQGREWDVVLDPIETTPDSSMVAALNAQSGSWGPVALEATDPQVVSVIDSRAKRVSHVYILDTAPGAMAHPAFKDIVGSSKVFVPGDTGSDGDTNGHGTHCAGIVAGIYPGKSIPIGTASILRKHNAIVLHFAQVLNDSGSGSFTWISNALNWVYIDSQKYRDKGEAVVVSMSLGADSRSTFLDAMMKKLRDSDIAIFAAAGNTGRRGVNTPGHSDWTEAVSSIAQNGTNQYLRSSFSTYGPEVVFAGPGSMIFGPYKGNSWATLNGTSMATPNVVAVYAILASINPNATSKEIIRAMGQYSMDLGQGGRDEYYGFGLPQLKKLVVLNIGSDPGEQPDEDPTPNPEPEPKPDPTPEEPRLKKPVTVEFTSGPQKMYVNWRNRGPGIQDTAFWMPFTVTATLKSDRKDPEKFLADQIGKYFKNRGLILNGSEDQDTIEKSLYFSALFLELELVKRQKEKFRVTGMHQSPTGIQVLGADLPRLNEEMRDATISKMVNDALSVYNISLSQQN